MPAGAPVKAGGMERRLNPGFIPEPSQLQVFQRSFSTKGRGRGIGTYSMKMLTEEYLGGAISFRSSEREGTTFNVILPREIVQPS